MDATLGLLGIAKAAGRPAVLAMAVLVLLAATAAGTGSLEVRQAAAQPLLEADGACDPDAARPGEPVLITCTVTLANTGDETATNLVATVGPASGCEIPIPTFIDLTLNGELLPTGPLQLTFELGDLEAGATLEAAIRLAVENYETGPVGGSITVVSRDDPDVMTSGERCWDVSDDAEAPPRNLQVMRALVTEYEPPAYQPLPEPPPPPDDGVPVPVEPVRPASPDQAEFQIVVSNVSDLEMTDVSVLDVQTGGAVLVSSDPPATGTDALGRPVWELGTLAPGADLSIRAAYGPPPEGDCAYADGVLVVNGTPAGGFPEDYVALGGAGMAVGPCGYEDQCWHYPPEGDPEMAPCDVEVCWAVSPDTGEYYPAFGGCEREHCWYVPPGEGEATLQPCAEQVCWLSHGSRGSDEYLYDVPCDTDLCEYTAPDGSRSYRDSCEFPMCWTSPPGNGEWRSMWDCYDGNDLCWFVPPDEGDAELRSCDEDICWLSVEEDMPLYDVACDTEYCDFIAPDGSSSVRNPCEYPYCWSQTPGYGFWEGVYGCGESEMCWFSVPGMDSRPQLGACDTEMRFAVNPPEGAVDFGYGIFPVDFEEETCWPVPPDGGEFYTYPLPCDQIEYVRWFFPPNGGPAFPMLGQEEACWQPLPPDVDLDPGVEIPPDLLIPGACEEGDEPKMGEPGSSIPVEVADAVGTPAEIVQGTVEPAQSLPSESVTPVELVPGNVEQIDPLPSAEVIPAELIRSERVEPAPPDVTLPIEGPGSPSPRDDQETGRPPTLPELLGFPQDETEPQAASLPDSGAGRGTNGRDSTWPWVLAAAFMTAGLLLTSAAVRLRRRTRL